jgi:small subunit ribosomal protein S14
MSSRSKLIRDRFIRFSCCLSEYPLLINKLLVNDVFTSDEFKFFLYFKIFKYYNNVHISHVRNRCIYTGRSRGINRFFRMSRILVRSKSGQGLLTGVKRSSW